MAAGVETESFMDADSSEPGVTSDFSSSDSMESVDSNLSKLRQQLFFSSLSRDVLDKVMRQVPLEDLLRWRLVSKAWNQIIMSKRWISETNFRSQRSIPLLLNYGNQQVSLTKAAVLALSCSSERRRRSKWTKMEIDLKEAAAVATLDLCNHTCEHYKHLRCTTAGSLGLMFFTRYCASHFDTDFSVLVYNPVTRRLKALEIPNDDHGQKKSFVRLAAVIVDKNERHYKLLFSTLTQMNAHTFKNYFVYDSQTRSWKFESSESPAFFQISSSVSCNGRLYFLHSGSTHESEENILNVRPSLFTPQLGIYDAESDEWYAVQRSKMPKHDRAPYFPQLVQHKGTVFYVVLCQSDHQIKMLPRGDGIHQWFVKTWCFFQLVHQPADDEFETASMSTTNCSASNSIFDRITWTKVREMPRNVFEAFDMYTRDFYDVGTGRHDVCCEGQGDFIYFYCVKPWRKVRPTTSTSASAVGISASVDGVVLLHDFEKNEWTFLKRYPPLENADVSTFKLVSFRPSLVDV